ncbi:MAG: LPS-assembly protein LptD [Rhodobacteraceae bacterium]|nr:LPS assembly protein LptD [Alphaproteobacteria bacterium]NNK65243.1 LPS-assembly protein LptD [Paracoccaceae bacterium]
MAWAAKVAIALAALLSAAGSGLAQTATLVADSLEISADSTLIAEGNVEVYYEDARLTATRVTYDRNTDRLTIDGPLILVQDDTTILMADSADLDTDLTTGILRSARLVLDRQLQIAAAEIARTGGRYTRLSRIVASSCEICAADGVPAWEIRASRVIRDEEEKQLYFDNAQLRVAGLPVFYIPRLRLPDPTLKRATGFLVPELETRSSLSTGIKVPYFVRIGDHADITLSPYLSSATTTLETSYRQAFASGDLSFEGAVSRDDLRPDATRAYLFAEGRFDLPRDFTLAFDLELVSDTDYLLEYGYSEKDRLDSSLSAFRVRDDQLARAAITSFRTLRASEIPITNELPNELGEIDLRQRLIADPVWGQLWVSVDVVGLRRPSETPGTGRDVSRFGAAVDWETATTLPSGIVAGAEARLRFDQYVVDEDPAFTDTLRTTPAAAITLAWPLERTGETGVRHLLEPTAQLAWAETSGDPAPNEDSTAVEFDEGNLFALSRFPGNDAAEEGLRANFGLGWTRYDPEGWTLGATLGRVYRFDAPEQFGADSGLAGTSSDWLAAVHYRLDNRIGLTSRLLIDDNLDVNNSETRVSLRSERASLAGTYLFRAAEPSEGRLEDSSELALDGGYRFDDYWSARGDWRFEADAGRTTAASVGVKYENECIGVDLSLSRRFTSTTTVEPATDITLRVFLTGFGTGGEARPVKRRCGG